MTASLASLPVPASGDNVRAAALSYIAAGFSILPVWATKQPATTVLPIVNGRHVWSPYQRVLPTTEDIDGWLRRDPGIGIGIICGSISTNISVLDFDYPPFCIWLERELSDSILRRTWTVRTGSGKLHVYFRSDAPAVTTKRDTRDGKHRIFDLKGEGNGPNAGGSYVVAPPSVNEEGGVYTTLFNGPLQICTVKDPLAVGEKLIELYYESLNVERVITGGNYVLPPLTGDNRTRLAARVEADDRLSAKIVRGILGGIDLTSPDWAHHPSNNEPDFAVYCSLLEAGWEDLDIEQVMATFPVGERCYQRRESGGSYGHAYHVRTLANARERIKSTKEAAQRARGVNFAITRVIRDDYGDDPTYELSVVELESGEVGRVIMTVDEIISANGFEKAFVRDLNFTPILISTMKGKKGFQVFYASILRMAERQNIPEEATNWGYLKSTILQTIIGQTTDARPDSTTDLSSMGWRDAEQGMVYFRGAMLIAQVASAIRPAPTPKRVYGVIKRLGGSNGTVRLKSGEVLRLWNLPLASLAD